MNFQVTFDAASPRSLAEFWELALGYTTHPLPPEFSTFEEMFASFGIPEEEFGNQWALVDPAGQGPRLYFQKVPEGKTAKNRVHLDIRTSGQLQGTEREEAVEAHVAKLVAAGGTAVQRVAERGGYHVVMQDPEGNEFCVT
jgi:hypothetical protein